MPKSKNRRANKGGKAAKGRAVVSGAGAGSSKAATVAPKVGPIKYIGQVRQEARKVVWPSWQEVWKTTILVMIMVVIMGLFFFVVDWALVNIVRFVLNFWG